MKQRGAADCPYAEIILWELDAGNAVERIVVMLILCHMVDYFCRALLINTLLISSSFLSCN
jgi:hypothetical protein